MGIQRSIALSLRLEEDIRACTLVSAVDTRTRTAHLHPPPNPLPSSLPLRGSSVRVVPLMMHAVARVAASKASRPPAVHASTARL